jgi:hypothetical protein
LCVARGLKHLSNASDVLGAADQRRRRDGQCLWHTARPRGGHGWRRVPRGAQQFGPYDGLDIQRIRQTPHRAQARAGPLAAFQGCDGVGAQPRPFRQRLAGQPGGQAQLAELDAEWTPLAGRRGHACAVRPSRLHDPPPRF